MGKYLSFWIFLSIYSNAKTSIWFICMKYSKIVKTKTAIIPFV